MIPFYQYAHHSEDRICEWIDGEIDILPSPSAAELRVRDILLEELGEFIEGNEMGLFVPAPFPIRMPEEMQRGREPDLLYIPSEYGDALQDTYVNSHGVGLVIEIADKRTLQRDRTEKLADYQMAGIPEYWIIDTDHQQIEFYLLSQAGYQPVPLDAKGIYHSRMLRGYAFYPASLWVE